MFVLNYNLDKLILGLIYKKKGSKFQLEEKLEY